MLLGPSLTPKEATKLFVGDFVNAKSIKDLAKSLREPYRRFTYLVYALDPGRQYKTFSISKHNGEERVIESPVTAIKNIQRKLSWTLAEIYRPKHCVHGFVHGKGIVSNAISHVNKNAILKVDLKNFFNSINFGRVRGLFLAKPFQFPPEVATAISRICCYNGSLPHGAPTSPIISNMICLRLDAQLLHLAKTNFCTYTRYADDITISTKKNEFNTCIVHFNGEQCTVGDKVSQIIESNGFSINDNKTKLLTGSDSKYVTGIKVNSKLNTSRRRVRQLRAMIHALAKYGEEKALAEHISRWRNINSTTRPDNYFQILQGKLSFIEMVKGKHDKVIINLKNNINEILETYNHELRQSKLIQDKYFIHKYNNCSIVRTEGKTDAIHLRHALRTLQTNNEFTDLKLYFYTPPAGTVEGDTYLKQFCMNATYTPANMFPIIVLFDRDVPNQTFYEFNGFPKLWGNNIWSLLLPTPDHRHTGDKISIEHYYSDETLLLTDDNGRRLYFYFEFNSDGTNKCNARITCEKIKSQYAEKIIDEKIFLDKTQSILLSKKEFARNIVTNKFQMNNIDLDSFRNLFNAIEQLVKKHTLHKFD